MDYTTQPQSAAGHYAAPDKGVFGLALRTGFLSLITLGIYRFWAKTRLRRYFWANTRFGSDGFEYTGTGLEKFLGFLVAVVVLAVYLAVVQLILFQFGLYFVFQPKTEAEVLMQLGVFYLSLFAIAPLLLFAQYRSRRYKLARTRCRGIRFGMQKEAGGYVLRGIGYLVLTILSLGILWPLMTYRLEAYMTNRTWYGDTRFTQGGRWLGLYSAYKYVLISMVLGVCMAAYAIASLDPFVMSMVALLIYLPLAFGYFSYSVQSFGYLTRTKRLGNDITFQASPRTGTVLWRLILGYLFIGIIAGVVLAIAAVVFGALAYAIQYVPDFKIPRETAADMAMIAALSAAGYLTLLTLLGAMALAFITEPIVRHFVATTTVVNIAALDVIRQRMTDKGADAEGFADALDWGGAI